MSGWTIDTLKELIEQRFAANEKAMSAALAAAEKAVDKAEQAQQRVNITQNEFRGTLKDQAADLMPRAETESLVRELNGKIDDLKKSRDETGGHRSGVNFSVGMFFSGIGALGVIIGIIVVLANVLT